MKKYEKGAALYEDNYWGRVQDSFKLYHPLSALYSDLQLMELNEELKKYLQTGETKRSNEELWNLHYIVKGNLHPETEKPVNKLFRWSTFVPINIPIIIGISVLPPTPFNQIFFQSLNQSYNFGLNTCNASASNTKPTNELITSYLAAIGSSIIGSAGLREIIIRSKLQGPFGKLLLTCTPIIGLIFASSVNLYFSRSKELKEGIPVTDPETGLPITDLPSKVAAKSAFMESLLIRWLIPIPLFVVPRLASGWAAKNARFYQKTLPKLAFDSVVVGASLWGSLIFVLSGFSNTGYLKLNKLEPEIQQRLKNQKSDSVISFAKGL